MGNSQISAWVAAIRPKTLFASMGPVLLGSALVIKSQHYHFNVFVFILILLCALLLQISSNLINDFYDHLSGVDQENRLGPTRMTASGAISPRVMKKAFMLTLLLSLLLGLYLMFIGGPVIVIIGILSILFCYLYTGGPYPLSHYALGEVLAFIFFGPVPVVGSYLLLGPRDTINLFAIPLDVYFLGAGVGFLSALLMSINNLRDIDEDKKSGKMTIAVMLGFQKAKIFSFLLLGLSALMLILAGLYLVLILYPLFIKKWIRFKKMPRSKELNQMLAFIGKFLFLYSIAVSAALLR